MAKSPADELAEFYQQHPACYSISKSLLFMKILRSLAEGPKSFSEIISEFHVVSAQDIVEIMAVLVNSGLTEKIQAPENEIFRPTPLLLKFLEKLDATKKFFE